jgi:hypothetical protein
MNKEQLKEDYPVGSMVQIIPVTRNNLYGIVVGYEIEPNCGSLWIWIHSSIGEKQHWPIKYLRTIAKP